MMNDYRPCDVCGFPIKPNTANCVTIGAHNREVTIWICTTCNHGVDSLLANPDKMVSIFRSGYPPKSEHGKIWALRDAGWSYEKITDEVGAMTRDAVLNICKLRGKRGKHEQMRKAN